MRRLLLLLQQAIPEGFPKAVQCDRLVLVALILLEQIILRVRLQLLQLLAQMCRRLALAIGAAVEAAAGRGAEAGLPLHAIRRLSGLLTALFVEEIEWIRVRIVVEHAIPIAAPFVVRIRGRIAGMMLIAGHLLRRGRLLALGKCAEFAEHLRFLGLLLQRAAVGLGAALLLLIGAVQYEGIAALQRRAGCGIPSRTDHARWPGAAAAHGRCVARRALSGRGQRRAYVAKK